MKFPKSWLQKDGLYSWIVLLAITVNGFRGLGWLFGSIGVLADVFPGYLGIDATQTNALGSTFIGMGTFTGRWMLLSMFTELVTGPH